MSGGIWGDILDVVIESFPFFLTGASMTIKITVLAVTFGCILGLFLALLRLSKNRLISFLAVCYIDFFRGTPLLVQILIIAFGIPNLLEVGQSYLVKNLGMPQILHNYALPIFVIAVLATTLNSGAYIAEIFRAGVQSIDRGQMEAARSLGLTHAQAMRYIILPQAFKRVVPPLGNEFIAMLKDTSLLSVIGLVELTRSGQLTVGATYKAFPVLLTIAFIYLVMTLAISRLVDYLERRLKTGD
ncbi:glutamate transport membrane-spanning protein [Desulfocucumis palustris]|uniref:Glutamate transport membrane-spanning protein n=1 Tax=Desulfocucumis palustris TaxID=1898651 RepID=A0A2L2XB79_9FIRM|nr:amino acid ABC transporter permease [Desulfocucumis palustris]GBF33559.1 glutamate transport membrane-spanning protein [Desulfocucumis palustris]